MAAVTPVAPPRRDGVAKLAVAERTAGARSFAVLAVASTVLALVLTAGANAVVNPRADFPVHVFKPLTADLAWEKYQGYEGKTPPPTALIFGTSRGMFIPSSSVPDPGPGGAFNYAFPGGEIPAIGLVWDHIVAEGKTPQRVVYALDGFAIRSDLTLRFPTSQAYPAVGGAPPPLGKEAYQALQSLSALYVRDTARSLALSVIGFPQPINSLDADGTAHLPEQDAQRASGTFDQSAALEHHYATVIRGVYGPRRGPDPALVSELRNLLAKISSNGTRLQVVLPPFHPTVLARLQGNPTFGALQAATLDVVRAACGPNLEVYDFTDISSFGGRPEDFYDGYHGTAETGQRMMEAMATGQGDLCASA
jgi:hypothetical protein